MVNFSSSGALRPGKHPVWFVLALYLILGLGLAASADAEHLSQRHSHARKSLDHTNSNAKRAPVPQLNPVRQVSGSLLDIGANGVGVVIGGEDGLIDVTLPPGSTSAPAETATTSRPESTSTTDPATATESTSTSDATTSLSDESISVSTARTSPVASSPSTSDATSSVSDSTSISTTTSPPTTTAPASTSPVASLPATSSAPPTTTLSTETASEGSTTTSCAAGLSILGIGVEAVCVPITTSTPISTSAQPPPAATTEATTNAQPASSASDSGSSRSDGLSTFTPESSPVPTSEVITGAPPAPTTSDSGGNSSDGLSTITFDSSPLPSTSEACNGVLSLDLLGDTVCVPSILPTSSEQPEPSSDPVTSFDPSDSATQSSPDPAPSSDSGSSADPSTTCTGLLCGILPGPTSDSSSGAGSAPSTISGQEPTDTDSSSAPPETSVPGVSESESTTCTGLLCGILPTITSSVDTAAPSESEPTITSEAVTTSDADSSVTTTSESCSGPLCSITSLLPPITITTSSPGDNGTDSITSLLPPVTTTTSSPGENSTDSVSPPISTPPPDTSELPPVENSTTTITSDLNTTTILPPITTTTTTPGENSTVTSDNATSTDTSSIAFPTGNTTTSDLVTLTSAFSPPPTSVASEFSFLTQSSLLFSEITTSASPSLTTLTNPDEATTSATLESAVTGATVSSVPLPSGLPAIIYPAEGGVSSDTILTGYTHVSILFDASLAWPFVANNTDSAAQIFAYFPVCLQVALGISLDQVRTFALQAYKTSQYRSPEDISELRTLYISYIPDSNVTALEQAIKAKQSNLYTRTTGISNQLAQRIDVSYSVTSAPDPIAEDSGSPNGANPSATSSNTRRDAIIGVCSALGGIAVCILGFLLYRNFKRRQEAAHHRLAEPQTLVGPTPGQDFDRDSIGGQRRRSFYYAEDSLRGFAQPGPREDAYTHNTSPAAAGGGMRERRTIAPGTISAPILRDNTLNW